MNQTTHVGPRPVGSGFILAWTLFRIAIWVTILVWLDPRVLKWVGLDGVGYWLMDHRWVRVLGALPLGLLAIISAFEVLNDPRKDAARQDLASAVGGTVVRLRDIDPLVGIPDGPGLRVPFGRWSMTVGTWKRGVKARTVARATMQARSSFSFLARGSEREPESIQGLEQLVVRHSMSGRASESDDPRGAAATFAYLAEPPIRIGSDPIDRTVTLRANQPDAARALFRSPALVSAVAALNESTRRWDWSYYPSKTTGMVEMRLEYPGTLEDQDMLRVARVLFEAALEELTTSGQIAA